MLVTTAQLASHLTDPSWVVFDCRHDLMDHGLGHRRYGEGHIPGAHFVAVETDLSGRKTGRNGRHPLPAPETFAYYLALHGVATGSTVVAYDDSGGPYAARLWWMTRWIGHHEVALLDGGFAKWAAEGRPIDRVAPPTDLAKLVLHENPGMVLTAAEVLERTGGKGSVMVDARPPERFRGEVEPIDPVAGHIPGSVNRPYKRNLTPELTMRPAAELHREFTALTAGVHPSRVGHLCGSGVTACANLFAMEYAGLPGSKLYAGSWSEWVVDPRRPVTKG